jgi:uncharacterized membrane protein YkoI
MNTARLRSKRVVLPTIAAVAVLGVGGVVWTSTANADVQGAERDRVVEAVTRTVDGTVVDVEAGDDPGEAYEVEVRQSDGTEVDVVLDQDLDVVSQGSDADDDRDDTPDADDRALSATERASAEEAALGAVGGGTVTDVEAGDGDESYEVEVRAADGTEWDVELGADFTVLLTSVDD